MPKVNRQKKYIFLTLAAVQILPKFVNPDCINSTPNVIPFTYFCGIIRYFYPHVNHKTSLNNSYKYFLFMFEFFPCQE